MEGVLKKLNMQSLYPYFEGQNITPDIVCLLSSSELKLIGITQASDMMRLRTECVKFGSNVIIKDTSKSGAPKFNIPKDVLVNFIESGFLIS